ncbi:MAG: (d)CMP kinase [Planctomycetia bacterium]|nr:(d)CMP kinase [Planctomycetia bacterium]
MIVTIDGPAGAGKSSAAKALARRLGFKFLDTGAMYRAVALVAIRRGHDFSQAQPLIELARGLNIELASPRVMVDGEDVSDAIRTLEITSATHYAADNPGVRELMVERQRQMALGADVVTEGRDQGTVVFPEAECKIFLTASAEERASRRLGELRRRGEHPSLEDVLEQQNQRDLRDSVRKCGPLKKAADAIEVVTDGMTPDEVLARLEAVVRSKMRH